MAKGGPHVFLSARGDLLPRWREAFPSAIGMRIGDKAAKGVAPAAAWVRLGDEPMAATLDKVRRQIGATVSPRRSVCWASACWESVCWESACVENACFVIT